MNKNNSYVPKTFTFDHALYKCAMAFRGNCHQIQRSLFANQSPHVCNRIHCIMWPFAVTQTNPLNKHWRWSAKFPQQEDEQPLFVFANYRKYFYVVVLTVSRCVCEGKKTDYQICQQKLQTLFICLNWRQRISDYLRICIVETRCFLNKSLCGDIGKWCGYVCVCRICRSKIGLNRCL